MARMRGMSRFTGDRPSRSGSWYRGSEAPFLLGWSLWLGALAVVLALGLGSRRSPAEAAFDRWTVEQQRPANWRKCHDQQPLPDGMVRCEAAAEEQDERDDDGPAHAHPRRFFVAVRAALPALRSRFTSGSRVTLGRGLAE